MTRYRKRPVEIDAVQLRWTTWNEVCELLGDALPAENPDGAFTISASDASDTCGEPGPKYIGLDVRTVHGEIATVRHGDWIIPDGEPGRFYPCKPGIFAATYDPADGQPASPAPLAAGLPHVQGRCPACGWAALFLGDGGYVTCSIAECPEPDAASTLLERQKETP